MTCVSMLSTPTVMSKLLLNAEHTTGHDWKKDMKALVIINVSYQFHIKAIDCTSGCNGIHAISRTAVKHVLMYNI